MRRRTTVRRLVTIRIRSCLVFESGRMMKSVVVSLLLVAVCFSVATFADENDHMGLKETIRECANERNIDPEDLKAMMPPKTDDEQHVLDCVATCTLQKRGMQEDNKLLVDKIKEGLKPMGDRVTPDTMRSLEIHAEQCAADAQTAENEKEECKVGGTFVHCLLPAVHSVLHHRH